MRERERGRVKDLMDEALESGELVHGEDHVAHVVGHVGGGAELVGGDGAGEGLVKRLQALAQCVFRLLGRRLQRVDGQDLLLR